jgi:hypothetical protein
MTEQQIQSKIKKKLQEQGWYVNKWNTRPTCNQIR